jgi:hypothetical protein
MCAPVFVFLFVFVSVLRDGSGHEHLLMLH